jgi:hypothetical protein
MILGASRQPEKESAMKTLKACLVLAAAAAASSLGAVSPASATINVGDALQIIYYYPDLSTPYETDSTTFTGPGTTLPILSNQVTAAFDPNQITLTQNAFGQYDNSAGVTFNGLVISDLTNPGAFTGWTAQPGGEPTPFTEYLSGGSIYVNWTGAYSYSGAQIVLAPGPVPGAGLASLAALALAGLYARMRRA